MIAPMPRPTRTDAWIPVLLAAAAVALGVFGAARWRTVRREAASTTPVPSTAALTGGDPRRPDGRLSTSTDENHSKPPEKPASTPPPQPPADPAGDAYAALLGEVNDLMEEQRLADARDRLDAFARDHARTPWADLAARNRDAIARMETEEKERNAGPTVDSLEADLRLLEAAHEFDRAFAMLDTVPENHRDEAWDARRARVLERQEEFANAAEPAPAEHPARAELEKVASQAERLSAAGDHGAARKAAEGLQERLHDLDIPALDEEFGPRAAAVIETAALADLEAALPGVPTGEVTKGTAHDRVRALITRRDALAKWLAELPRLQDVRMGLRKRLHTARNDAIGVIFNKTIYPDEAHGVAGQGKVDEKVKLVRRVWDKPLEAAAEGDSAIARAVEALAQANELLSHGDEAQAKKSAEVMKRLEEAYAVRDLALDETEQKVIDRNRTVEAFNGKARTSMSKAELEVLTLLNGYREMMGLRILEIEEHLVMSARWHSTDMRDNQYFAHIDKEGRGPRDRAMEMQYEPVGVGENCAAGIEEPARVHWGFYYSSGHHRNMLMRGWVHVGIGMAGNYWTQDFGNGHPQAK